MWFLTSTQPLEFKSSKAFELLLEKCKAHAVDTRLIPVTELSQLCMTEAGKTTRGFTWETAAFQQLCDMVAGGLYGALKTLWDVGSSKPETRRRSWLRVYHNAVDLGFSNVDGVRLVTDMSEKKIVGVVGRRYKFVSNHELLKIVQGNFKRGGTHQAYYGQLRNRDICLLGVCTSVIRRESGVAFRQGVGLYNSETTRQAIYVPRLFFDSSSTTFCVEPAVTENWLAHRSKKGFAETMETLVVSAFTTKDDLDTAVKGFQRCSGKTLWTASTDRAKVMRSLVDGLREREVGVVGINSIKTALELKKAATMWDLYQSLVLTAAAGRSERILRVSAFKLLVNGTIR